MTALNPSELVDGDLPESYEAKKKRPEPLPINFGETVRERPKKAFWTSSAVLLASIAASILLFSLGFSLGGVVLFPLILFIVVAMISGTSTFIYGMQF